MYHTITAAKPLTFKKTRSGMQTIRKMKLILLSFHERFLNFNEKWVFPTPAAMRIGKPTLTGKED